MKDFVMIMGGAIIVTFYAMHFRYCYESLKFWSVAFILITLWIVTIETIFLLLKRRTNQ